MKTLPKEPKEEITPFPKLSYGLPKEKGLGSYNVFLRRYGKFKQVGTAESLERAFNIGTTRARQTLGATFLVRGAGAFKTPKGFYAKKEKVGTVFIQKRGERLGTYSERAEIQKAKRSKLNLGKLKL